ncbi:LptA/OstA family protein [Leptotrichia massiliensis]|uniref:LptA/OstA family protein n=1 Tax=Leptotrichia massiliensis TaxID=1852388 RepID=UPI0008D8DFF3|nr:immunoglobulin-like domain-containing protein [Leptotrichia massiliensis]
MWKKIAYGGLVLILIYFIYAVFFKKIPTPLEQMQKDMKAKKVVYRLKDDAIIYADEQIGSEGDEVIKFKNVIVDLVKKQMIISGKEGEVNTKTSDVTLMKKVVGTTKDKKWEIYTERVEYKKQGDLLISPVRTKLINTVDDTVSEADRVETTTKFETIVAIGNASYNNKKDKKTLTADKITYHDPTKVSDAEGHVIYKEEQTKRELRANKMRYDDINKIGNAEGNVIYTDPENKLTGNKVDYYMKDERIDGQGNIVYTGKNSVISADTASYFVKKKQVDGRGHVKYTSPTLIVTGDHVFYDEIARILNGDGNGTYNYLPRKTTGTYRSGVYDLKTETLTTNDYYTANYDDYKMDGTGLIYVFPTGDATMNGSFNVKKQNFNVHGANGTMNTISKDIFANKMEMTSVQGDRITSDTGRGSFEKKEFRFDGHVKGKIRGNIKDLVNDPTPLVESEAVNFIGNTAKVYFVSHKNGSNMSITRSEIKENVHMTYKDITLDSQYNEMDSGRNLILARDKVMVDFKNNTKMTANYLYMDMNKQEGYARNNVKIVSTLPQFRAINTSADKATIYLKDKKIKLNGNVVTYQGKTQISSKSAIYDMDKRILENEGNIQMQYEIQNNEEQGRSDPKNAAATQEVIGKLSIPEGEVSTRGGINLPKSMTASNGVPVTIKWRSSNSSLFSVSGRINKQFYGGGTKGVTLTAIAKAGVDTAQRTFNVSVPTESAHEMLVRAAKNIYVPEDGGNLPSSVRVNVNKGTIDVPISWSKNGDRNVATLRYGGASYQKQF